MRQTPLLLLLLLLHGSGAGAGGDNMKLMKEMFEIQDRYTSARLQNPALDSLFRGVAALTKAEIKVGAATVVGVLSTMQIDTGSVDVAEYTAMVYDAAAETDAGSLKLSGALAGGHMSMLRDCAAAAFYQGAGENARWATHITHAVPPHHLFLLRHHVNLCPPQRCPHCEPTQDVRTIMAKAAAHFGVSDATLSAVARMVVARFNGLTYEEAVTLSVEFLETVSDMFMGERVKGVAVRQHVGKVVRVVAESCMEAAQESPLFDSATKINVDPSLLDNLDSGSMGALGATTVTEALALFGEIRHGA